MKKNTKDWKLKIATDKKIRHTLTASAIALIMVVFVTSAYAALSTSLAQPTINIADPKTQFKIDIAYAYVGQCSNSYIDSNGKQMSLISQYPTSIVFNVTRLPGVLVQSCDAIVEVYKVQIATEKGETEDYAYTIGTNYNESYDGKGLSAMVQRANDLVDTGSCLGIKGDIRFHWTDNESILSHTVGSICYYTTFNSSRGLWREGTPDQISITVNRIGYITIGNNAVTIYKDSDTSKTTSIVNLAPYNDGFICNKVVSPEKLPQTNLFSPISQEERMPSR